MDRETVKTTILLLSTSWLFATCLGQAYIDFGTYTNAQDGNKLYFYRPMQCSYNLLNLLYSDIYYKPMLDMYNTYQTRYSESCCFRYEYRNKCCQGLAVVNSGTQVTTNCKCQSDVMCGLCPAGWTHYSSQKLCLRVIEKRDSVTFDQANAACAAMDGGTLLKTNEEPLDNFVKSFVKVWIGITWKKGQPSAVYTDNTPLGTYTNWKTGTSTTTPVTDQCAYIGNGKRKWGLVPCTEEKFAYACQMPDARASPPKR